MTKTNAGQHKAILQANIAELAAAIDRLISPRRSYMNNTFIAIPSLYKQLVDSMAAFRDSGARGVARSRPPLREDSVELLSTIDLMVNVWPTGAAGNTVQQLQALALKAWHTGQTRQVRTMACVIEGWCDEIEKLVAEEHTKYLRTKDADGRWHYEACPACGATTVEHRDSAGDIGTMPALRIITEFGCTCHHCGHYWAPDRYVELAKALGGLPAGVLE